MQPNLPRRYVSILIGLIALAWSGVAHAQEKTPTLPLTFLDRPLLVGIYEDPPFVIVADGNTWDGLSVQLWREMAEELGLSYQFVSVERNDVFAQVADGTLDLAIAAVATVEGEEVVDFTQSYLTTQLGTAELRNQTIYEVARAILSPRFLSTTFWVGVMIAIAGALLWFFEGRQHQDMYGERVHSGLWAGFWWAAVTLSTTGYGDIVPRSTMGRVIALLWMLLAMVITASLTATITSVITLNAGYRPVEFPAGLDGLHVGVIADSAAAQFLDIESISYRSFESAESGIKVLHKGEIDVFVDNVAVLRYLRSQSSTFLDLNIQTTGEQPHAYTFALAEESELLEPFNRLILARINSRQWQQVIHRFMPE